MTALLGVHGYAPADDRAFSATEARRNPGVFADYRLIDADTTLAELAPPAAVGCRTVVDATPIGLGRSPNRLLEIAQRTALNLVMGCGRYLEGTHPPDVGGAHEDNLARELIAEIRDSGI